MTVIMYRTLNIVPDLKAVPHKGIAYFPEPLLYYHKNTLHSPPHSHLLDPQFSRQPIIASFGLQHFFILWDISVLTIHSADLKTVSKIPCENKYGLGMTVTKKGLLLCGVNEVQFMGLGVSDKGRWGKQFWISSRSKAQAISYIKGYWLYGDNLLLNSLQQLFIYNLQTMELLSRHNGVVRKEFPMTKAIFNEHYSYFLLGLTVGEVLVHKPTKKEPLHLFKAHRTSIQALNSDSDSRRFWSVSSESLRLWNLDTFTMAFQHQFQISYNSLKFLGTLLYNQRPLALVNLESPDQLIADVASQVLSVQSTHSPSTVQITLNNNLGVQVNKNFLAGKDIHKNSTRTFYPPLKSKGILQIASVPGERSRFLMLIENGEICWTRLGEQSSTIQNIIDVQKISDEEGKLLLQKASFILLPRSPLPKIDPEVIGNLHFDERRSPPSQNNPTTQLIIGCSKGAIVAVDFSNPKRLFARLTYHREAVVDLKQIQHQSSKQTLLISLCLQHNLRVIRTSAVQTVAVISVNTGGALKLMHTLAARLFCVVREALEIFTLTSTFELEGLQNYQHPEHQGDILSVSVSQERQLVATTGQDNLLKLRNFYKVLLFQIVFSPNLNHAFFLGKELDLVVANDCKLFLCRSKRIHIDSSQEQEATMAFLTSNPRSITIERIFRQEKPESSESVRGRKVPPPEQEMKLRLPSISENSPKKKTLSVAENKGKGKEKQKQRRQRESEREKEKPLGSVLKALEKLRGQSKGVYKKELQQLRKVGLRRQDHVRKESLMDKFMREKVLEKKVLTRREVTTNRIIMKNIIKDYMHEDHDSLIL